MTRDDIIMMSLSKTMEKQWENANLRGNKENICLSKDVDESYPNM